jgi:hypothetical protein
MSSARWPGLTLHLEGNNGVDVVADAVGRFALVVALIGRLHGADHQTLIADQRPIVVEHGRVLVRALV